MYLVNGHNTKDVKNVNGQETFDIGCSFKSFPFAESHKWVNPQNKLN